MSDWSADDLQRIDTSDELLVAARRADGSPTRAVPVWVVRVGGQVCLRTWYRRDTGWFGRAVDTLRAHIEVPGVAADVAVEDIGAAELRAEVDAAYRAKYRRYGTSVEQMVSDGAAATTLRLRREDSPAVGVEAGSGPS